MRVKVVVSYDGTNFCGWQIQPNGISVQQTLENAVLKLSGEKVTVTGSGRTDAGVHANAQVCHFDLKRENIPAEKIYLALNTLLPKEIRAIKSERTSENFDARKSAKKKTYRYNFYLSSVENPLCERYAERLDKSVSIEKLKSACSLFVGEHNFKAFSASGGSAKTFVRTIYNAKAVKKGDKVYLEFTGSGFLYNMVRLICGAVISFANGKLSSDKIKEMLKTGERNFNIKTMPAKALVLHKVNYN